MRRIEVLSIQRVNATDVARIAAVDPSVHVVDAGGWYDGEIRDTWPPFAAARYLAPGANGKGTRAERDALLAGAEIILGGWPYPLDLRSRAPNLKWFHQRPAGASNLLMGDLWGSNVTVTTSRGAGNTLAIAEYAIAGILHFARGFHVAHDGTFDHRAYRPLAIDGKTLCVIGVGGIGQDVGRLGAGWLGHADLTRLGTRCRPASPRWVGRMRWTASWPRPISSLLPANGPRKPPV